MSCHLREDVRADRQCAAVRAPDKSPEAAAKVLL
jgi:hypothetical protein